MQAKIMYPNIKHTPSTYFKHAKKLTKLLLSKQKATQTQGV